MQPFLYFKQKRSSLYIPCVGGAGVIQLRARAGSIMLDRWAIEWEFCSAQAKSQISLSLSLSLSLSAQSGPPVCSPSPAATDLSGPYVNTFFNAAMYPVRVEKSPDGGTPLCRPGQHSSWCVGWGSGLTGLFLSVRVAEFWHATVPRLRLQVRSCRPCQTCCFFVACQPHEPWTD